MPYTPDATDITQPDSAKKAQTIPAEFIALKTYLQAVILPLINSKLSGGANTFSATQSYDTVNEAIRIKRSAGYLSFFNDAGTTRTGYMQGNVGGSLILVAETAVNMQFKVGANSVFFDGGTFFPSGAGINVGSSANRWNGLYAIAANFSGDVSANRFFGDGSNLTGISGATMTGSQIIAALGFTPYSSGNPAGYQTSAGSVASAVSAGTATLATKASTLAQNGGNGTGMTFNWSGQSGQPTWAWGSNDGVSHYVYNPSNFSVLYAASAGAANSANTANSANSATTAGSADHITNASYNGYGLRTVSTSAPSGGSDGDVWYQV